MVHCQPNGVCSCLIRQSGTFNTLPGHDVVSLTYLGQLYHLRSSFNAKEKCIRIKHNEIKPHSQILKKMSYIQVQKQS